MELRAPCKMLSTVPGIWYVLNSNNGGDVGDDGGFRVQLGSGLECQIKLVFLVVYSPIESFTSHLIHTRNCSRCLEFANITQKRKDKAQFYRLASGAKKSVPQVEGSITNLRSSVT